MRRHTFALALVCVALAGSAAAGADVRRMLRDDEAAAYRGVGRLNVAGARFCTATLISERLIVTAAHCLYNPRTRELVPRELMRFVAGLRRDSYSALRPIAAYSILPEYAFAAPVAYSDLRRDLALLELASPVKTAEAQPHELGMVPEEAETLAIVSYARDRAHAASIQEACPLHVVRDGIAVLGCEVVRGISGAPVFAGHGAAKRLVAVVSSMGKSASGEPIALAVLLDDRLVTLRAMLDIGEHAQGLDTDAVPSHLRPVRRP